MASVGGGGAVWGGVGRSDSDKGIIVLESSLCNLTGFCVDE